MRSATIFEAKTTLSELVRRVQAGEEILITSGRERKPVARLVAVDPQPPLASRRIGFMQGEGSIGTEFWDPLPFDRMIAAQAIHEDIPVLSNDAQLDIFAVRREW